MVKVTINRGLELVTSYETSSEKFFISYVFSD